MRISWSLYPALRNFSKKVLLFSDGGYATLIENSPDAFVLVFAGPASQSDSGAGMSKTDTPGSRLPDSSMTTPVAFMPA
jgi:hypothetical protein